jgi:hypothetical protein
VHGLITCLISLSDSLSELSRLGVAPGISIPDGVLAPSDDSLLAPDDILLLLDGPPIRVGLAFLLGAISSLEELSLSMMGPSCLGEIPFGVKLSFEELAPFGLGGSFV